LRFVNEYWLDQNLSDRLNDISIDISYSWAEQVNDDQDNDDDQNQDESVFENALTLRQNHAFHGIISKLGTFYLFFAQPLLKCGRFAFDGILAIIFLGVQSFNGGELPVKKEYLVTC
jgi:hypothetical protein